MYHRQHTFQNYKTGIFLSGLGLACLWLDHALNDGEYTNLSFIAVLSVSLGVTALIFSLLYQGRSFHFITSKYLGPFLLAVAVLVVPIVYALVPFVGGLMSQILNFSFGLVTLGLAMIAVPPETPPDEELADYIETHREKELAERQLKQAPTYKKAVWVISFILGLAAGLIFDASAYYSAGLAKLGII